VRVGVRGQGLEVSMNIAVVPFVPLELKKVIALRFRCVGVMSVKRVWYSLLDERWTTPWSIVIWVWRSR